MAEISGPSFLEYLNRFRKRFSADAASWARDNIFWGIFMFLAPLAVLFLRQHQAIDWGMVHTTLWIYLSVFLLYLCVQAVRTPWKLDADRAATINALSGELGVCRDALSDRSPKFLITTHHLCVVDSRRLGVAEPLKGTVGILEVHIVNTSQAPGNVRSIDVSVDVAGNVRSGVPIVPMFVQIWWRKDAAPNEPMQPNIEIPPTDFLTELIDAAPLTQNRGLTRWFLFFVEVSQEELRNSVIVLSVKDATGREFRSVSNPNPERQMARGYSV
jgi:hypothetical protein